MNATTQPARSARPAPAPPKPPRGHRPAWQWPLLAVGTVLAAYLVGRGIVELFTIHYADPASYAADWGGPSLAGVLAVHTGPAVVIIAGTAWRLLRLRRRPSA
jgi:hypothetical protein